MAIINMQRRLVEVGQIRVGAKVPVAGKSDVMRPKGLETFRFTSANRALLEMAAKVYGGTVHPWAEQPGEYELVTNAKTIRVMISMAPVGNDGDTESFSQHYELWNAKTCLRRCNGQQCQVWETRRNSAGKTENVRVAVPCQCNPDADDFYDRQKAGTACKLTSRLSVILPDVPTLGLWKLRSNSTHFAEEVSGLLSTIRSLGSGDKPIFATITIEWREKITGPDSPTERYPVPRVELDLDPPNMRDYIAKIQNQAFPVEQSASIAAPNQPAIEAPKSLAGEYLRGIGVTEEYMIRYRAECKELGYDWRAIALAAKERGVVTSEEFQRFAYIQLSSGAEEGDEE